MTAHQKSIYCFYAFLAFTALGLGLSFETISNYLRDAYHIGALERGFLEFPREFPGVIGIFIVSYLAFIGDIRIAIIGEVVCIIAILLLGTVLPSYSIMVMLLFMFSIGMHLLLILQNSIGLSLIKDDKKMGTVLGRFNGTSTAFSMVAMAILYIGFKIGYFSYSARIIKPFILCAISMFFAVITLIILISILKQKMLHDRKIKWIFRKEYKYYYLLTIMSGVQKQIMFVFGPWVLIEMLNKKADTISMLFFIATFLGIFFIPFLGKLIDKFGVKKLLYADAISFVMVYICYGLLTSGFRSGVLSTVGVPLILAYILVILDKMSMQMTIIRTVYLKNILVEETDLTKTLSMGMSLDHIVTIIIAASGGLIWYKFGAEYIFYSVAILSLVNVYVAYKVDPKTLKSH